MGMDSGAGQRVHPQVVSRGRDRLPRSPTDALAVLRAGSGPTALIAAHGDAARSFPQLVIPRSSHTSPSTRSTCPAWAGRTSPGAAAEPAPAALVEFVTTLNLVDLTLTRRNRWSATVALTASTELEDRMRCRRLQPLRLPERRRSSQSRRVHLHW
jgi:hypothetical protein